MRRGEIRWVDLDPSRGAESDKRRPVVIVSNDGANMTATRLGRGVVTVVPVTSNTERVYPFQVLITAGETGLTRDSKAQAEQVRSIAVERLGGESERSPAFSWLSSTRRCDSIWPSDHSCLSVEETRLRAPFWQGLPNSGAHTTARPRSGLPTSARTPECQERRPGRAYTS